MRNPDVQAVEPPVRHELVLVPAAPENVGAAAMRAGSEIGQLHLDRARDRFPVSDSDEEGDVSARSSVCSRSRA